MRFYVTSDNHGSLMKIREQRIGLQLDQDCGLIILGDVGFNYHGDEQDNRIKYLENELQKQYEATCEAKDRIVDLLNEKRELERKLAEIHDLTEK